MTGEPIGTVDLASGDQFNVAVIGGQIKAWFSRQHRYFSGETTVTRHEADQIAQLLNLAARVEPSITVAQENCRRLVLAAEASYESLVASVIAGAR